MKDRAKQIIRNIVVGAIVSIYHTSAQAADSSTTRPLDNLRDDDKRDAVKTLKNRIYRNVLQITSKGGTKLIAGHRSHMSHRSGGGGGGGGHYSHASHYSSYGGGHSTHSSHSSHSSSSYAPAAQKAQPKTYKTYALGDRTLKSGMYGNDVSELTSLLVSKKYLHSSWITMQNGYPIFNARVVSAVKRFQKDANLSQDGIVNTATITKLREWDASKSTLVLGIRNLSYKEDTILAGNDVDELISLLRKVGIPPNPALLQYQNGTAIFTKDIEIAVKLFQAYNGLNANGVVDEATIAKLNATTK